MKGSVGVKLHSLTKIIYVVCLDLFGANDFQKGKTIRTANRRQREKSLLRVKQRLHKKWLREMPDDQDSVKKQLSEATERILVIAKAENARKQR